MSKQFDEFVSACGKAVASEKTPVSCEFVTAAEQIGAAVEAWGLEHGLMKAKAMARGAQLFAANESFTADQLETGLGPQAIADLIAKIEIPACHKEAAAKKVATVLCHVMGKDGAIAFADYNANNSEMANNLQSLESLFGAELWSAVAPSTEAFGIQMDRVTPDLKTVLTVALLQFHVSLTPRIVPIQTVTQSNVQITRESMEVFDLSKPEQKPTRVIELYRDPTMVSVRATRIQPLMANDGAGKYLVADGIYKFQEDLNLFKLAIDASKPGYEKFNHTDIVEDGIVLDGVLVRLTSEYLAPGGEKQQAAVSEQFMLSLPIAKSRLTQIANDYLSTERRLSLDRTTLPLDAETAVYGSTSASSLLAYFTKASGKFLGIRLNLNAHVDRKTAAASASAWGKLVLKSIDGDVEATAAEKAFIEGITLEFVGFTLDARYNEDNKRKTSIRAEINRRNMSYELPAGRNFVIDSAIGQEGAVNAAARLAQLEHIGRDGNNLKIITEVMKNVHDQRVTLGNGAEASWEIASSYAAGDLVNQTVYMDQLDFATGFLSVRSSDATGDIKQFVKTRLNKIVTGLNAVSLIQHQMAEGAPLTYRMITSPFILGTLLSFHHIHAHLDGLDQRGQGDVEFVMQLDCGARLEVVTTTFDSMKDKMVIIPFFASAPTSVLNFGTDFDQGTLVGAVTLGADSSAVHNRLFSTTREILIPTNVVGAVIDVVGLGDARVAMTYPGLV